MRTNPFADLPPTPVEHFKLYFYAAVLRLIAKVVQSVGSFESAFERFPFLAGYNNELAEYGAAGLSSEEAARWWCESLKAWEEGASVHLPLRALSQAAELDYAALTLLFTSGLLEEDERFGFLFESLQGGTGQHRPTMGLLNSWCSEFDDRDAARVNIRRLRELGMIKPVNPEAPRVEWALQIPEPLWDAIRGEKIARPAAWARYREPGQLAELSELILPDTLRQQLKLLPALFASGEVQALTVRGPQRNGRRTIVGAAARMLGRGVLEIDGVGKADDERWKLAGPLATLLNAVPLIVLEVAPGETAALPGLNGYEGPLATVMGIQGGVIGPGTERALTLVIEMPDTNARSQHWLSAFGFREVGELDAISQQFRMTGGNIRRAAALAQSYASLNGRSEITIADVQEGSRALNRQVLDTLAARLSAIGDWNSLAVAAATRCELDNFEARCRHRERLRGSVSPALGAQLNCGVRALFTGPSGTGKTLAARLSASVLRMDIYRLDLSSVVNKYIGETEKNLNQVFARAEELDVILLLDEGDALLTQRTDVQTSNDRYANLETNFLLQRLETFEGILIVTTNAGDRIDSAFQRRMDVVVEFRPPDPTERWAIWQLHLPQSHTIDEQLMQDLAARCILTGGQIRNAALHASLLALNNGGFVTTGYLLEAVQREYRKTGTVCPLRVADKND
jgi:hypothetical protein